MSTRIAMVAAAAVAWGFAMAAQAGPSVHVHVGVPSVQVQPVHAPVQQGYRGGYRHARQDDWSCGAPRWHPQVRYMPGQVVRRHGELWVAKPISARVWNENSPPEWTPQYWVQAVCGG